MERSFYGYTNNLHYSPRTNLFITNLSTDFYVDLIMIAGVPLLLVIIAIVIQWPVIKYRSSEYCLMRTIKRYGKETMHDVMLPDSLGGATYIEHIALTANAIVVIYLKRYRGVIFAGEHIDDWTQVINNHSYRFPNPLQKLEMDIMAIKNLVTDANIEGKVVFTRDSEFPKGRPDSVALITELQKSEKAYSAEEVNPLLYTAWKRLQEQTEPCSKEFVQTMRETTSVAGHGWLAAILILAAIAWLLWFAIN